jgi:hypothetical protein
MATALAVACALAGCAAERVADAVSDHNAV